MQYTVSTNNGVHVSLKEKRSQRGTGTQRVACSTAQRQMPVDHNNALEFFF